MDYPNFSSSGPTIETPPVTPEGTPPPPPNYIPVTPQPPPSPPLKAVPAFNKKFILIIPLIIIGFVAAFLFIKRLGSITKSGGNSGTLTYWGLWEEESVMAPIISEFQKSHPKVKISYIKQSPNQYRDRLENAISRGEGPDIFRFHNTWLPMIYTNLAPVPSTVFDTNTYEKTFYSVSQKDLSIGTSYYGIPIYVDTLALYINTDLFSKANLTPPTTWEDLRKDANLLTEKDTDGRISISGVALGTTSNIDHWSDILGLMMYQNGVDFKKIDKSISPDGKNRGENTLSYYTQFNLLDHVWDDTLPSSTSMFASGKLAMYFAPSWRVFEIKAFNPSLNFKVIPVPQLSETNVNWATYWVEGVNKKSTNQATAWEFLKFLSTKETITKLYSEESKKRLFGEIYGRSDMANLLQSDPVASPFLNQILNAKSWYLCSNTYDNGINDKMIQYFGNAINSIIKGGTTIEALTTASLGVKQLLSLYHLQ